MNDDGHQQDFKGNEGNVTDQVDEDVVNIMEDKEVGQINSRGSGDEREGKHQEPAGPFHGLLLCSSGFLLADQGRTSFSQMEHFCALKT